MRSITFYIVFGIIIAIYALINFYIYKRAVQSIPQSWNITAWFTAAFILIAASYLSGRLLEKLWLSPVSDALVWIGSIWLGMIVYFLIAIAIIDLIRAVNHFAPFFPQSFYADYGKTKLITGISVTALVMIITTASFINAHTPAIREITLEIDKKSNGHDSLIVAIVSDIHLGTTFTKSRLEDMVARINSLEPDLILLAGDIVDEDLEPVIRNGLGESLKKLNARYGNYAVTGNHEYIGGVEKAVEFLTGHGIRFLRDSSVLINNSFYIVGREDRSIRSFTKKNRKDFKELFNGIDLNLPVIMMDHQPHELDMAAGSGADLQISGHTHHGQLFPFNFITKLVYRISWGHTVIGNT
ncbi:MAG: metallophosphoesterase, partial [Candidatus Kapaibacterium sp.]